MTRNSFHLARVPISNSDKFLLFHTLRGAVDVISQEVVSALEGIESSDVQSLGEPELAALRQRGYLTEQPLEQELGQARDLLRLLSRNLSNVVELSFRFPDGAGGPPRSALESGWLEKTFSLAKAAAGEGGTVIIALEISTPGVEAELLDEILTFAAGQGVPLLPRLTLDGLHALTPRLKSEYFRQAVITTDRANMPTEAETAAAAIISYYNRQIHPTWKCNVDGMSDEQLRAVVGVVNGVRQKYPFFKVYMVSQELEETSEPSLIRAEGASLPYISAKNDSLVSTLLRFILMPGSINYRPFFQPEARSLTFDLRTGQLSYRAGEPGEAVEGFEQVEAFIRDAGDGQAPDVWETVSRLTDRVECKYALVCGCRRTNGSCAVDGGARCSASFESRLKQVVPLLFFNLQGNQRPQTQ